MAALSPQYLVWERWREQGGIPNQRPTTIPKAIGKNAALFAKWRITYAQRHPKNLSGYPLPDPLFSKHCSVFVSNLSGFNVGRLPAFNKGFKVIVLKIVEGARLVQENYDELVRNIGIYKAEGWKFVGWQVTGNDRWPQEEVSQCASLINSGLFDGWKPNCELWYEGVERWRSSAYCSEFRKLFPRFPISVSCLSSDTAAWPRFFDYTSWLKIGANIDVQAYQSVFPNYTIDAGMANLDLSNIPKTHRAATISTYSGMVPWDQHAAEARKHHIPISLYLAETTTEWDLAANCVVV